MREVLRARGLWPIGLLVLLALAVVSAGGCGPGQTQGPSSPTASTRHSAASQGISVDAVGAAWGNAPTETGQNVVWSLGAMITNHSVQAAEAVRVEFTAYGAGGDVVGTVGTLVGQVAAGDRMGVSAILAIARGPVSRVTATTTVSFWTSAGARHSMSGEGVQVLSQDDGNPNDYTIDGALLSTYTRSYAPVPVYIVCVDGSGRIVGAGAGADPVVEPGGIPSAVSVPVYAQAPASCGIYGSPIAP